MRFRREGTPPAANYGTPPEAVPPDNVLVDDGGPYGEQVVQEEYAPPPPPEGPERNLWPWLLLLLALVLGGLAALYFLTRDEGGGTRTVTRPVVPATMVPSVVGLRRPAAAAQLRARGFRPVQRGVPSARPVGLVTGQRPRGGERIPRGSEVVVVFSTGPEKVAVPDVLGLRAGEAAKRISAAGLAPASRGVFAAKPRGVAVGERPPAGTRAARGSKVLVEISKGRRRVVVPSVVDTQRSVAERRLRQAGFVPVAFPVPASDPKGTVVAQSPRAGLRAVKGAKVRINVSQGVPAGVGASGAAGPAAPPTGTQTQAPARVAVPDVLGLSQTAAQRKLRRAGLFVNVYYVSSTQPQGTVVAQRPHGGTSVRRGSTVRINVSTGPSAKPLEAIPDVVGEDEQTATSELRAAGFQVEVFDEPTTDPSEDGFVVDEQPAGGTKAPQGSIVTISVGRLTQD
jgi:beta-lactam-binding protein with PASTA domain